MARKKRKSSGSGGNTFYLLLTGIIIGLAAATAVALFVTQAPMPFSDKFSRAPAETLLPDVRDAPDPNIALYGKNAPAGTSPNGDVNISLAPLQGSDKASASLADSIGDLIATLTKSDKATGAGDAPLPVPGTSVTPDKSAASAAQPKAQAPAAAGPSDKAGPAYYLQAGAFRSEREAQAIKAKILMLGLPVQVQTAQVSGDTINRVRVGPFKGIDEMNRSRQRLSEEKIESSVVRPQ